MHHQKLVVSISKVKVCAGIYTQPMKNLNNMNWLMLVDTAAAMVKIMNSKLQL